MLKRISLLILGVLILGSVSFAQDKVDIVALRNGIKSSTITVTTSATAIPTTAYSGRRSIIIVNISTNNIFIGASDVTTANGYQLYSQQAISIDAGEQITIYAIAGSSSEVRCLEIR